ncbi:DNA-binding response regulator [Clostridium nigeriense]|uniref:DNA-binding response regulator n=1 Tax=Clostridium nigeriense TaxID=1805470 RepID=UPI003D32DD0E
MEFIKKLYLEGYNSVEIARIINTSGKKTTKAAIQKYIQRNLKEFKEKHDRAVIMRKEALKAVNYESKKYMTDKTFILKNRSIYETKENGDIVIKKDITTTWDTPKRLVNENKSVY